MTDLLSPHEASALAAIETVIHGRQHLGPKHLGEPGPSRAVLERLFHAAAAAPDHGQLRPWRFVVVGPGARAALGEVFAQALRCRDPSASEAQCEEARGKALRAPCLIVAIADLGQPDPDVPDAERLLSLGCAIQNLLLSAQALGYASGLTSGRAMDSAPMRQWLELREAEQAVCFINLGTPLRRRATRSNRPQPDDFVRWA